LTPTPTDLDARTFKAGQAFSFITDIGNIDVRFSVDGIGGYDDVLALSQDVAFGERTIRLLSIKGIIASKTVMGRTQDRLILPELEMMREAAERKIGPDLSSLPIYELTPHEVVDRREDFRLDMDQTMRVLGRSDDGDRVFGRCGGGILSVAREAFVAAPRVDERVTLSRATGRDIALVQGQDLGIER